MMKPRGISRYFAVMTAAIALRASNAADFETKSGIRTWVDPDTPEDSQSYTTSRGETWELVMSDEFNTAGRSFEPGSDHMWTSLEKPDGVNAALEVYSHNMTSTKCDDDGTCYFYIKTVDEVTSVQVWNSYLSTPGYEDVEFVRVTLCVCMAPSAHRMAL